MGSGNEAHVLVVVNGTVVAPALLEAARERAELGTVRFHVLVPAWSLLERRHRIDEAELVLELALPLFEEVTGSPVGGSWSARHDPMDAIEDALRDSEFDEIILCTVPHRFSRRLHIDLPRRVAHFGLPLTVVNPGSHRPGGRERPTAAHTPS